MIRIWKTWIINQFDFFLFFSQKLKAFLPVETLNNISSAKIIKNLFLFAGYGVHIQ